MIRLLFCEPWPVSNLHVVLSQFLEGIISLFITRLFASLPLALSRPWPSWSPAVLPPAFPRLSPPPSSPVCWRLPTWPSALHHRLRRRQLGPPFSRADQLRA